MKRCMEETGAGIYWEAEVSRRHSMTKICDDVQVEHFTYPGSALDTQGGTEADV